MDAFMHTSESLQQSSVDTCPHCQIQLDSTETLSIHMRMHVPVMQGFPCHYCEKVYSTEGSLVAHQSTHTLLGSQQFGEQMFSSSMYGIRHISASGDIAMQQNMPAYSTVSSYANLATNCSQVERVNPLPIHTRPQYKDITQETIQQNQSRDIFATIAHSNFDPVIDNRISTSKTLHFQGAVPESSCISSRLAVGMSQTSQTEQFDVDAIHQPPVSVSEDSTNDVLNPNSTHATNTCHSNSQPTSEATSTYQKENSQTQVTAILPACIPVENNEIQNSQNVQNNVVVSKKELGKCDLTKVVQNNSHNRSGYPGNSSLCQNNSDVLIEDNSTCIYEQVQPLAGLKASAENCQEELSNSKDRTTKDNVKELEKSIKQHWASVEKQIAAPTVNNVAIFGDREKDKSDLNDAICNGKSSIQENSNTGIKYQTGVAMERIPKNNAKPVIENERVESEDSYRLNEKEKELQNEFKSSAVINCINVVVPEAKQMSDNQLPYEDVRNSKKEVTCSKCNQEFQTTGGMKRHMTTKHKRSHTNVKVRTKTRLCERTFNNVAKRNLHKRTHKGTNQTKMLQRLRKRNVFVQYKSQSKSDTGCDMESLDSDKGLSCGLCKKLFKNLRALNMHKLSHKRLSRGRTKTKCQRSVKKTLKQDGDALSCKECHKTFKSKQGLTYHMANHNKINSGLDKQKAQNNQENNSCDTCAIPFQTKKDLSKHLKAHHPGKKRGGSRERPYVCSTCGKAFLERSHLREHEKRHGEADIPCQKCDKKFKFVTDLRKHQRSHSDAKPFTCTTCGNTFKASSHLLEHELRHGEPKFSCQFCGKKYHVEREMKKHEKIHTDKSYPCPHCAEEFREKIILQEHIREHEQAGTAIVKQFICTHCKLYFSSQKGLLHHLNNKHREMLKPEEQWQFVCNECNRVCPSQEALRHHKKLHKGDRVYPCSRCDKFFKSGQHLREHEKRHGEPTLMCPICNWKFVLAVDLRKHEKRHAMNKSLPCTHCDKKFSTNGALNAHIKRHSQSASSFVCTHCKLGFRSNLGLKYHQNHKHLEKLPLAERWTHLCTHCDKVFPTKSSMLRHKNMQGRYSCQMCNLAFRTEKAYKLHQQIHLGLRSHCCPVCQKGFKKAHHLAEHMKRHGEGKHPCRICGKKYVFLTDLRKHVNLSHLSPKLETCTQCDKKFLSERMLRQHILLHHQAPVEKQYVCFDCNLQLSGSKGLMSHMNNKHRDKLSEKEKWKFQCTKCHRMFRSAKALDVHGQVHSSNRPHECHQCGKRFKEARHLMEHKKRHGEGQHPCLECDKKYVFERDLVKHIKTHSELKEFVCTECGKGFVKNSDLNAHLMRHEQAKNDPNFNKDKHLQCPHCRLHFVHKKGLDTHVNNKHREMLDENNRWPFWCARCKKAFRTKIAMTKHEPEHLGTRNFICEVCNKRFKEARHLSEHQKRHEKPTLQCQHCDKKYVFERDLQKHEKIHSEERPFKCPKCIRQYGLKSALDTHMKQHQHTQPKYTCQLCTLGFTSNLCLQNHLNNKHREQLGLADRWDHICKFCSKAYSTEQGLMKHEKVHRNLKVHSCKICGKHFKLAHHLTQHEKRHQEGELECQYCQKKYVFASDLRKHVRIHTGEKPFCCEHCGKRFRVSGGLRKHLRLHDQRSLTGLARPYKCKLCNKSFRLKDKLAAHKKIHEKQFECTICSKMFCFQKTLQRHVLTHSVIKPFTCTVCSRQFIEETALSRHLKKHENGLLKQSGLNSAQGKQYPCNYCTLYFATDYKKKYHMNKKHRDVLDPSLKWVNECRYCHRPFATFRALQRHETTHTNEPVFQCLLCPIKCTTSQQFVEHEKSHSQQQQQHQLLQQQQQIFMCKYCSKAFVNPIDCQHHENSHASDAIVTVPLNGDLSFNQDGLVQVALRDTGYETAPNQQVSRTDGHFEILAELISAANNILTLN